MPHAVKLCMPCVCVTWTYFLFSGSHLSFPLHLASGNACKLPRHSPRTADRDRMPLGALYGGHDLDSCDAFVSRLLCYNLYLGPFGCGVDLGLSRISGCCGNLVGICGSLEYTKEIFFLPIFLLQVTDYHKKYLKWLLTFETQATLAMNDK